VVLGHVDGRPQDVAPERAQPVDPGSHLGQQEHLDRTAGELEL
jgi:hypothetical protein